jgi:hypothetical protein
MTDTSLTPPGRRPIEVGRVIREAFAIYGDNLNALLGSAVAILVVPSLIQTALIGSGTALELLGAVLALTAGVLYTGFVVKLVQDLRDGRRDFTARELISSAAPYIGTLIVNGFLLVLGVALGLVLLIVPGLYLVSIWAVCSPAIVAENKDAIGAFRRSKELAEGQKMQILLTVLATGLIIIGISAIGLGLGTAIAGAAGFAFFNVILTAVTGPIFALVSSVMFFDLGGGAPVTRGGGQIDVEY